MISSKCALVTKFLNAQAFLETWKMALVSASVESAAIDVWMLLVHEVITAFSKPTLACIDCLSGKMFAKAASL